MILGIMGAMPDEVDQLCAKLENVTVEPYGGVEYHKGTLAGKQVVVCCAGMGKANAAATTQVLITKFGAEKIIWLPNGIYQDETNEHVDNVCAFTKPGEVVLAWTDDESDPQYVLSAEDLKVLEQETDAKGRKIRVHKMPIPKKPVCITEKELAGYVFEEGEDTREAGERLAASYVNFYIGNKVVLVPQFGDEHDVLATDLLQKLFPEREIVPIFAREIIIGGGNIHCITQQIPVRR